MMIPQSQSKSFLPFLLLANTSNIPLLMARCSLECSSSLLQQKLVIQEHREHLFAKSDNIKINQTGRTEGHPELGGWASLCGQEETTLEVEAELLRLVASGRPKCVAPVCYGSSCSSADKYRNNRTKSLVD